MVEVSAFYMDTNLVNYTLWQQVWQWAAAFAGRPPARGPVVGIEEELLRETRLACIHLW